jgi:hypothetical protein
VVPKPRHLPALEIAPYPERAGIPPNYLDTSAPLPPPSPHTHRLLLIQSYCIRLSAWPTPSFQIS